LSLDQNIEFQQSSGNITIDGQAGSTLVLASTSNLQIAGDVQVSGNITKDPAAANIVEIGSTGSRFNGIYTEQLDISNTVNHTGTLEVTAASGITMQATSGNAEIQGEIVWTNGILRVKQFTRTQRNALTNNEAGDIIYTSDDRIPQVFVPNYDGSNDTWVAMAPSYGPEPSVSTVYPGMIAIADGSSWDPEGDGQEHLMCYLNGEFRTIF
jgi:hypothetical protein